MPHAHSTEVVDVASGFSRTLVRLKADATIVDVNVEPRSAVLLVDC